MGGYAAYVWSAFGITLVLMVGLFVQSRWSVRRRDLELEQLRTTVRPQRARTVRPMRPTRESSPTSPSVSEGS